MAVERMRGESCHRNWTVQVLFIFSVLVALAVIESCSESTTPASWPNTPWCCHGLGSNSSRRRSPVLWTNCTKPALSSTPHSPSSFVATNRTTGS